MKVHVAAILAAALALSGCSSLNPFSEEENVDETGVPSGPERVQMNSVDKLELGRVYRGYMLSVEGTAPSVGHFDSLLTPRGTGVASDGFLEFDLVAQPPFDPPIRAGTSVQLRIRADVELTEEQIKSAAGIRVYSLSNALERQFIR